MKAQFLKSEKFGNYIHFSEKGNKANIAKTANGSFYLYIDHFLEPLKLKDKISLIDTIELIKSEWLKYNQLTIKKLK